MAIIKVEVCGVPLADRDVPLGGSTGLAGFEAYVNEVSA